LRTQVQFINKTIKHKTKKWCGMKQEHRHEANSSYTHTHTKKKILDKDTGQKWALKYTRLTTQATPC